MREISLIMPMAGQGSRFKDQGWEKPKPLIEVAGEPFFVKAANSALSSKLSVTNLIFVVLSEHVQKFGIDDVILSFYPMLN